MQILSNLQTLYGAIVFMVLGLILMPLFWFFSINDKYHPAVYRLNSFWAKSFFFLTGITYKVSYEETLDKNQAYVFCPNHFSFIDIPTIALGNVPVVFMGKQSLSKVPILGYIFKRSHIIVDRTRGRSRAEALIEAMKLLERGISVVIFPEGGIASPEPPALANFKDGAFRAAIEKQIPIVPVSIPYNWIILPDSKSLSFSPMDALVQFHKPIETRGMDLSNIPALKAMTYNTIDSALKNYDYADRQRDFAENCAPRQA
ncbi:MAG: lysophospholipid acyltransferase family protein [Cyclobacteriaceae bacterium]